MKTLYYKFIAVVLGSLGLGCWHRVEYGMPYAKFHLSGRVIKATTEEIVPGIQIQFQDLQVHSDSLGDWKIDLESGYPCGKAGWDECSLEVLDTDGAANGGQFVPQQIELDLTQTKSGSGKWYDGTFEQHDITIELNEEQ